MAALVVLVPPSRIARAAQPDDPARICERVAETTERSAGLPRGLLGAIGVVESGRWQPALGRSTPWPYAINAGGDDFVMDSAAAAIAKVAALRADGRDSIDVGCFQINLRQHPDAFAGLDDAFDPMRNAAYAARFLNDLKERIGTWDGAVAAYHSGFAALGEPYRARVYAAWRGAEQASVSLAPPAGAPTDGAEAGTASSGAARWGRARLLVRVFVPGGGEAGPPAVNDPTRRAVSPIVVISGNRVSRVRLPRVFTPLGQLFR